VRLVAATMVLGLPASMFNNLLDDRAPDIDFAAHARSLGAHAQKVTGIQELEAALKAARGIERSVVLVIDTDPQQSTAAGGAWWDVAVPEVSARADVTAAYETYRAKLAETKKDP
jgi:3D-(3,5/4)-trihydroxycyclohexane-1,2-dione acylhydrolase (decyclizing)